MNSKFKAFVNASVDNAKRAAKHVSEHRASVFYGAVSGLAAASVYVANRAPEVYVLLVGE